VVVVGIVDVRNAFEARRETTTHLLLADETAAPTIRPTRRLEDAIFREVRHDRIEVVPIERVEHFPQPLRLAAVNRHRPSLISNRLGV
jgi:NADPH-dependent ferric siderophore reductase